MNDRNFIPDPDEDVEIGVCLECGDECRVVWHDEGIGDYECWGQRGCQVDFQQVSECCECEWIGVDEPVPLRLVACGYCAREFPSAVLVPVQVWTIIKGLAVPSNRWWCGSGYCPRHTPIEPVCNNQN